MTLLLLPQTDQQYSTSPVVKCFFPRRQSLTHITGGSLAWRIALYNTRLSNNDGFGCVIWEDTLSVALVPLQLHRVTPDRACLAEGEIGKLRKPSCRTDLDGLTGCRLVCFNAALAGGAGFPLPFRAAQGDGFINSQ